MRVEVLHGFVLGPGDVANIGDVVELSDSHAKKEIAAGYATETDKPVGRVKLVKQKTEPGKIENRDPR